MPTFVPFALDTPQVNRCRVCQGRWRLFFSFKIDESFYYRVVFIELFTLPEFQQSIAPLSVITDHYPIAKITPTVLIFN